jgi:hypothetical protein
VFYSSTIYIYITPVGSLEKAFSVVCCLLSRIVATTERYFCSCVAMGMLLHSSGNLQDSTFALVVDVHNMSEVSMQVYHTFISILKMPHHRSANNMRTVTGSPINTPRFHIDLINFCSARLGSMPRYFKWNLWRFSPGTPGFHQSSHSTKCSIS